eukprot:5971612-Heterocapsa_arctica.AAC.1
MGTREPSLNFRFVSLRRYSLPSPWRTEMFLDSSTARELDFESSMAPAAMSAASRTEQSHP